MLRCYRMKVSVWRSPYRAVWLVLFVLVLVANVAYLHRLPGLMGDEASEGYNVYELLIKHGLKIQGERSYIGVFIDYLRVPFMGAFGYTVIAIRAPMLLTTLTLFWLSAAVCKRLFDEETALWIVAVVFFSPVYLLYQRLGWAITLLPFFAMLLLLLLVQPRRTYTPLVVGVVAGLGGSAHILFLPTLLGIIASYLLTQVASWRRVLSWWPALVGFWAAFSLQFFVLATMREDQGDPSAVAQLFSERLRELAATAPQLLSGHSYMTGFVGATWNSLTLTLVAVAIAGLVLTALFSLQRKVVAVWLFGLVVHLLALVAVIDRLTPRYFVVSVLGVLAVAAVGLATFARALLRRWPTTLLWLPVGVAGALLLITVVSTVVPFLRADASIPSTQAVLARVNLAPLLACLNGKGPLLAVNPHIFNRLQYLSLEHPGLLLVNKATDAKWSVVYRQAQQTPTPTEACPQLRHFRVEPRGR